MLSAATLNVVLIHGIVAAAAAAAVVVCRLLSIGVQFVSLWGDGCDRLGCSPLAVAVAVVVVVVVVITVAVE